MSPYVYKVYSKELCAGCRDWGGNWRRYCRCMMLYYDFDLLELSDGGMGVVYLVGLIIPPKWQMSPLRKINVLVVVLIRAERWPIACPGESNIYRLLSAK